MARRVCSSPVSVQRATIDTGLSQRSPSANTMQPKQVLLISVVAAFVLSMSCSNDTSDEDATPVDGSGGQFSSGGALSTTGGAPGGGTSAGGDTSGGGVGGEPAPGSGGADMNWGGMAGGASLEPFFVPEDVVVSKLDSTEGGLEVIASTLKQGANGSEFYAALRKVGEGSACDANITIEFYDKGEQSMGAWLGAVYGRQLYWGAETGVVIACVDPGELAMVALVDEPPAINLDEVGFIVYRFSYFDKSIIPFELVAIDSLSLGAIQATSSDGGTRFSGTLENELDYTLRDPSVAVFSVTEVGRPLSMVSASEIVDIPAGGSWSFETESVDEVGTDVVAFPYGAIVQ